MNLMHSQAEQELFDQLSFYTLEKHDSEFIHQHAVDAFTAQTATEATKPIAVVFALAGLYLHLEKGFTGRQVQRAHMQMASRRKTWPRLSLPDNRGTYRIDNVLEAKPGKALDEAIDQWCLAVWSAYRPVHYDIAELVANVLEIQ